MAKPKISERKLRAATENMVKANEANETHGLYKYLSLTPDRWPREMQRMYQNRFLALLEHDHLDREKDAGLVAQICRIEVILARLYEHLMQHEIVDAKGEPAAVLTVLGSYENGLRRMYAEAGLSPISRKTLKSLGKNLCDVFAEIPDAGNNDQDKGGDNESGNDD